MFGSAILEAAVGLTLLYLLLSLLASAVQEALESKLKVRATNLELGLRELLQDRDGKRITQFLYGHPLVFGLFRGDYHTERRRRFSTNLPTYIPAANFAAALIDLVMHGPAQVEVAACSPASKELTAANLREAIGHSALLGPELQRVFLLALDSAHNDLGKVQANLEAWFNSSMDRVSGWYKRRVQVTLVIIGMFVAVLLNVDSLKVTRELYRNDTLRAAVVAEAGMVTKSETASAGDVMGALDRLKLPMWWPDEDVADIPEWPRKIAMSVLHHICGWIITGFAVSFGAPFWFDILNKLMVVRSTVKPHEKSPEESSEDRQQGENPPKKWRL